MPSNEQRRDAAKRKLERQLERRAQQARKRKRLTIAGSALGIVLVVGAGVGLYSWKTHEDHTSSEAATTTPAGPEPHYPDLPAAKAKPAVVNCAYPASPRPASKPAALPHTSGVKSNDNAAKTSVSMVTSQGNIGLILNATEAPCTVNSFASLAAQKYFDKTTCHRLTTQHIKVLQCGDPAGDGSGGPGYQFANEYPTDQYAPTDPALGDLVNYKRGTVAMANAGPGTNGSQFFLVYGDSPLPPNYTVFGTIDRTGLETLDKIAAAGLAPGSKSGDGAPKTPVTITSMQLD